MLLLLGIGMIGVCVYWVMYRQLKAQLEGAARASLEVKDDVKVPSLILKYAKKLYKGFIMAFARNLLKEEKELAIKRKIQGAGANEILTPVEFLAFKMLMGVGLPTVIFVYSTIARAGINPLVIVGIGIFAWFYPNLWLDGMMKTRHRDIELALPFVIDLMTLSTEAGLDFVGAIQKVVEKAQTSPITEELDRCLKEIQLGASRADALRNMAWRINMDSISSFVAILVTADQMGASIGSVLRAQSDLLRNARFLKAEKAGAAASQKILFPLIFLILPAVFIMIFGPVVLSFVYGGGL
jgi:tight adherence protein C